MGVEIGLGSILGAAAGVAGSGIDAWAAGEQQEDQMHFQEKMSNSAHVREVADLQAAGLNPILSAKFGGASTPPGAGVVPTTFANSAKEAANLHIQRKINEQTLEKLKAETGEAEARREGAALDNGRRQRQSVIDSLTFDDDVLAAKSAAQLLRANASSADAEAKLSQGEAALYEKYPHLKEIEKGIGLAGDAAASVGPLRNILRPDHGKSPYKRDPDAPIYRKDYKRNRYDVFDPKSGEIYNR